MPVRDSGSAATDHPIANPVQSVAVKFPSLNGSAQGGYWANLNPKGAMVRAERSKATEIMETIETGVGLIEIFGTSFAQLDVAESLAVIAARPPSSPFVYIATPNVVHLVGLDRGRPHFAEGLAGAWLRTCDSQIVRLFAWLLFRVHLPYAPGSDITARLFETVITPDDRLCIIGGTAEMAQRLRARYSLRHIAHHIPPPGLIHSPVEMDVCVAFVRSHPARFVFLACGAPQSELLGRRLAQEGGVSGLGLCIGASLLFVTGIVRRAPVIWRRLGLEWMHRLIQEPRRLARRLFTSQLPFLWIVLRDRIVSRKSASKRIKARMAADNPSS